MEIAIQLFPVILISCILLIIANSIGRNKKNNSETDESVNDNHIIMKRWLFLDVTVTTVGCSVALFVKSDTFYLIFIALPTILVSAILVYLQKNKHFKMTKLGFVITSTIVAIIISLFPLFNSFKSQNVECNGNELVIHGMYGESVPIKDIKTVSIVNSLPDIRLRTNGYSFNGVSVGYFMTHNGKIVRLYIHSTTTPYLRIVSNSNEEIYINFDDASRTIELYDSIACNKNKLH